MARVGTGKKPTIRALRAALENEPDNLTIRVALADRILQRARPEQAIELLEDVFDAAAEEHDDADLMAARRVLAFALVGTRRFDEAQRLAAEGLAREPQALDFHYLLAYIGHQIGSHALCEDHACTFLKLSESDDTDVAPGFLCVTAGRRYEVCNYLGLALENTGRVSEALAAYETAIEARRTFDTAWANLARLLARVGRAEDARKVLDEARRRCPRSKILPRVHVAETESSPRGATIALCMILKNEEEQLPRCLKSVKDLVDEIVVVDTGSTDRTVAIAESFGARVYHHPWEGDFSKARNIAMGYVDSEWILIMDADEELETADIRVIRHAVNEGDFKVIAVSVYNYSALKEQYTSFLPSNRLVRRDAGAYYEGIVHNQLRIPGDDGSLRIPARIYHYGYGLEPEAMARKSARSMALLEKQLEENPGHGFAHFNLAQLLRGQPTDDLPALMDRVIRHAKRAVELCAPDDPKVQHIHVMALHQLVTAYLNKGDYEQAATYARRALEHKPGYLDVILSLGHLYSLSGELDLARKHYVEYLERQRAYNEHEEIDQVILLHLRSRHNALYGLGLIALMDDKPREAVDWFERCIAEQDNYLDVHFRLGAALWRLGEKERAQKEMRRELELHPQNSDAREALTELIAESGDSQQLREYLESDVAQDTDDADARFRLARMEIDAGRFDEALTQLAAIPKDDPDDVTANLMRGEALYGLRRFDEAVAAYERCLRRSPDDPAVLNDIGNCHFQVANYAEAERFYRRVIDSGKAEHGVYRNLGLTLAGQKKVEDAIFSIESYVELEPDDVQAAGFLGDLYYEKQDYGRAIDHYERLIEQTGARADTLTRLGDCYLQRGALDAALTGYEAALKIDPENENVWERLRALRAHLSEQSGDRPAAAVPAPETVDV